jgi:spore coat protein SA
MACGVPAITTRAMGISEIIHHGEDGLILEDPTDAKTLCEWLAHLATDAEWRNQLGKAAAQTAAQHTWAQNSAGLQQLIEQFVKSKFTDD